MVYDLLEGDDGSRSVVREALVKQNYDFEMDFDDIFNIFQAVHVKRPATLEPTRWRFCPIAFLT